MIACRVLPHRIGDGPTNMAIDEALLDAVASDPTFSVVRTYEWSVPTLSLGYFQKVGEAEADPRWLGAATVRRPTGGGALWHDREITYAVVVPSSHPLARPSTALYRAIHASIADQLRLFGLKAERRGSDPSPPDSSALRPFLCFQDRDTDDVVVGRAKLVGSAQRRRSGAVLQHGSLLLARSPSTPELLGVTELRIDQASEAHHDEAHHPGHDSQSWATILQKILPGTIGGSIFEEDLTDWERDRADILRRQTYENPSWTRRR